MSLPRPTFTLLHLVTCIPLVLLVREGSAFAQSLPLCIPGTPFCARANGGSGVQIQGAAQGQAGPGGVQGTATGNANATAAANANAAGNVTATGNASAIGNANATGSAAGAGNATINGGGDAGVTSEQQSEGPPAQHRRYRSSQPIRFGAGLTLCGTVKAGVYSGFKAGPCFAVSFRTEPLSFEMESQLLFGGTRHSVDWVFPMSFVIPLTTQRSLYEGLQLRVGGSPIGVTFAKSENGGNYLRFGLHAGLSYEYSLGAAASWRVFDIRSFLDFGTRREVDTRGNFIDFGGQLSTGIVF